ASQASPRRIRAASPVRAPPAAHAPPPRSARDSARVRTRDRVLPIHGEVARSAGGAADGHHRRGQRGRLCRALARPREGTRAGRADKLTLMAQATKSTGAETVRWDLSELFTSPDDPRIEQAMARALERALAFESKYRGTVASLEPKEFAVMMRELAEYEESSAQPEVYAYMLHSQNTQDPAAGRLLARLREASAERGAHLVFIALELAQISDEQAAKLFSNPESARYRHHLEEARKFRPHQLSEPEERVLTDF